MVRVLCFVGDAQVRNSAHMAQDPEVMLEGCLQNGHLKQSRSGNGLQTIGRSVNGLQISISIF